MLFFYDIFFGHDLYGDYQIETLFRDRIVAVGSPDFLKKVGSDVHQYPDNCFIHTNWGRGFASSPNWEAVFQGQRIIERHLGMSVKTSSTALNLARFGHGVSLLPFEMAQDDLRLGRIQIVETTPIEMTSAYQIAYPKRLKFHPVVNEVLARLAQESGCGPS